MTYRLLKIGELTQSSDRVCAFPPTDGIEENDPVVNSITGWFPISPIYIGKPCQGQYLPIRRLTTPKETPNV